MPLRRLDAVYVHFGIVIHALELKRHDLVFVIFGHVESFDVLVIEFLVPARVGAAVAFLRTLFAYSRVTAVNRSSSAPKCRYFQSLSKSSLIMIPP